MIQILAIYEILIRLLQMLKWLKPINYSKVSIFEAFTSHKQEANSKSITEHTADDEGLSWDIVDTEIDTEVKGQIIQRTLSSVMEWNKRLSSIKEVKSFDIAMKRVDFSKETLRLRPNSEDWYKVLFSDEHHEGFDPTQRQLVARKPGKLFD